MVDLSVHTFRGGRGLEIVLESVDCWRTKPDRAGVSACSLLSGSVKPLRRCDCVTTGVIAGQCCGMLLLVACLCWRQDVLDAMLWRACSPVRASLKCLGKV